MKKLNFTFTTRLTFDNYGIDHSFALRLMPVEAENQHIISCELDFSPFVTTKQTVDAFGNNVTSGYLKGEHRFLDYEIRGVAEIDNSLHRTDYMPCYLYQSGYTKTSTEIAEFYKSISADCDCTTPYDRAVYFSARLSEIMRYEKNTTDTHTTAAQAFEQKCGVCQDFSHIMLSILRLDGIACRYIAGLACCDGETHSWLELWNGKCWTGFDPTNNCDVNDDYLALSQGRDFSDCAIDRGVMFGAYTRQLQLISSQLLTSLY